MKQVKEIAGFEDLADDLTAMAGSDVNVEAVEIMPLESVQETSAMSEESKADSASETENISDRLWNRFEKELGNMPSVDKSQRVFCRLDPDLAYTLDECRINNMPRTDMVNAIVRVFVTEYIERFKAARRLKKTLL